MMKQKKKKKKSGSAPSELVEARGKALVSTRHRTRVVLAVLGFIKPLLSPVLSLHPLILRKPAFDIGQGSREGELSLPDFAARVPEIEPFHSVGIWLVSGEFGPLVSHLVPFNALVAWVPPELLALSLGGRRYVSWP